jgi:hypothetical protein
MNQLFGLFIMLLAATLGLQAQGSKTLKKDFTVDSRKITCLVEVFNPPAVITMDQKRLNQSSVINCSYLFYSILAKGDVGSAAAISNDPAKVEAKFVRQKERVGEKGFMKMFEDYFDGGVSIKFLFSSGTHHMLIIHSREMEMDMAQFYIERNGKFIVDEAGGKEKDLLGKLYSSLKNDDGVVILK